MKKSFSLVAALFCCVFNTNAIADQKKIIGHMEPLPSELLPAPIKLPDCPGIEIVEWRHTPTKESLTSPTEETIKIVNTVCKTGFSNFFSFIKKNKLRFIPNDSELRIKVCIMPAKLGFYGENYRNLNDHNFRFIGRDRKFENDGSIMGVWGYTHYEPFYIFIRNDVINNNRTLTRGFASTFVHELFHALSYHYHVYDLLSSSRSVRDSKEEQLAISYENYSGY